jgi:hypothetical protein
MMNFKGAARRLDDLDLPRIGALIGVGEDEVHAILDVEAAGRGFDAQGRPKMLFEPHRFYKNLGAGPARDKAVAMTLAYPSWGEKPYPGDSYPRLMKAMAINREVALRSASWGLGQIMGFNHKAAGFASAEAMVRALADDEDQHLEAMIRFIKANGLDDELRRHDWAGFARGYNGPGFAKNGYDKKLKAAFDRWRKIPDTPWSPEPAPKPGPVRTPEAVIEPAEPKGGAGLIAIWLMLTGTIAGGLGAYWDRIVAYISG